MADALVTNGNSESVLAALDRGLPVVVLPSIWDQAEMAWRVAETGVGLRVSPQFASPKRLRQAVLRVLEESVFRVHARKIGAALALCGGPPKVAELIGNLARLPPLDRPVSMSEGRRL